MMEGGKFTLENMFHGIIDSDKIKPILSNDKGFQHLITQEFIKEIFLYLNIDYEKESIASFYHSSKKGTSTIDKIINFIIFDRKQMINYQIEKLQEIKIVQDEVESLQKKLKSLQEELEPIETDVEILQSLKTVYNNETPHDPEKDIIKGISIGGYKKSKKIKYIKKVKSIKYNKHRRKSKHKKI